MRASVGATIFRLFDKVIVAVLILLALFYVAMVVIREPKGVVDRDEVERLRKKIAQIQAKSKHTRQSLDEDLLSSTVGGLRPDAAGFEPRPYIMARRKRTVDRVWPKEYEIAMPATGQAPKPHTLRGRKADTGADIEVADKNIVNAEWSKEERGVLELMPLHSGSTVVKIRRGNSTLAKIAVRVKPAEAPEPAIQPPRGVAVRQAQGQAELRWSPSQVTEAELTEYRIYKSEEGGKQTPYLRALVPDKLEPDTPVPTAWAADGKPGPDLAFDGQQFLFADRRVQGGVTYWYSLDATGRAKQDDKKTLSSSRSTVVSVRVTEPFKIKFYTLSPDHVAIVVSTFHVPDGAEEAGEWVEYIFRTGVKRGDPVGWRVADVPRRGRPKLTNVDFSTGYLLLDILGGERRIREEERRDAGGEVIGVRQREETQQKVLLINERGRIRTLWPSVPGREP